MVPTQCLLFSSCLLVERSDPDEDQERRWPQERSTLHQQSPDPQRKEKAKFSQRLLSHLSSECEQMYESDVNHHAASWKIIFDLFSVNELGIFLRKKRGGKYILFMLR